MKKNFQNKFFPKQIIFFCCLLFSIAAHSQVYEAWTKRYNDPNTFSDYGKKIAVDGAGNVYVTGKTAYDTSDRETWNITTIKYDNHGNQLWLRTFDGASHNRDEPKDIAVDANGNVYITGSTENPTESDMLTLKYNTNGDFLWAVTYNGPANHRDEAVALALDGSGNVYITGLRDGNFNSSDIATVKYNSSGVQQWVRSYAGSDNKDDWANAIRVPGDGFVYVTGLLDETFTDQDAVTIKYNVAGDLMWVRGFNGPGYKSDWGENLDIDQSGNVYVVGSTMSSQNEFEILTIKYDKDGNEKWYKTYTNPARDFGYFLAVDKSNNIIVTGIDNVSQAVGQDIVTIKYDPDANVLWSRTYSYEDSCVDNVSGLALDNAGNIYLTGASYPDHSARSLYTTIKYTPSGFRDWVKNYSGPGNKSRASDIAVDAKGRVYVTGQSLENNSTDPFESGDWSYATIKYSKCLVIPPADVVANNTTGQCGAIVNYAAATTTGDCGSLQYSQASGTFFPVGTTVVTVTSASSGESATFNVTVKDVEAPKITCPANITVSCAADVPAPVTALVTATDNCSGVTVSHVGDVVSNQTCANRFTITRTYQATDGAGNTATCSQVITVNDQTPPQIIGLTLSQQSLWPPNHQMRDITVNYTVADNCSTNPTVTIGITSNEPVNGTADGDTDPDWEVVDLHHIKLRAERASNGNGRIYTVTITVDDGCNPPVSKSEQVFVAHNITEPQTGRSFKIGSTVSLGGVFWDKPGNSHTAKWLLDGSAATNGTVTEPSGNQNGKVAGGYKFNTAGVYKLQMNVTDQTGVTSYANTNNDLDAIVVIYDPNGGYSYGGGWFASQPGALTSNAAAEGKASYGFSVNYRNAAKPKGETQFEFKVGSFEFNALNFDYLVINGSKAQFTGTGKIIGGQSGVGFIMTVIDGAIDNSGVDKIRMKIFNRNTGYVYYDNQPGASDAADPLTAVGTNSSIVIQGTEPTAKATSQQEIKENLPAAFGIVAYPNPTNKYFTLQVNTKDLSTRMEMQVYDQTGRLLESNNNITAGSLIRLGENYGAGIYFVRMIQGKQHSEVKLVKF